MKSNLYKNKFQYSKVSLFIDSGANLVLRIYMVRFNPSIEQRKQFYNCKAKDLGEVWCSTYMIIKTAKLRILS